MSREFWEIVRADQLNEGDTLRYGAFTEPHVVESIHRNRVAVTVNETHRLASVATIFRRIPDTDDPRVLRRALRIVLANQVEPEDVDAEMKRWIEDAAAEFDKRD